MQNGFIVILIFKMNQGCKLADKKFLKYIFWLLEKGGEQKIKLEINLRFWNAVKMNSLRHYFLILLCLSRLF